MPCRRRNAIDPLQLKPGDYVVHEQHGVGRYVEMVSRTVQGATREYLVIEYAPGKRGQPRDRLFVPTDQLDQVTRYVGGEAPTLHRLGGADWAKTKGRARKAVKEIAAELIRLYSARMASPGYAFGPDTPWQRELEDAFPYVETPDQLAAIDEVKADMEKPVPMDRLICGDVGYGKTEIAVRAAFKAVQDGKQVAVLVPTTLLVQQHIATFAERYAQFPVTVRPLSRFQTDAEATRDHQRPGRRHRRHRDRHAPAAVAGDPVQGPRPGHRRRGAAVRRRAQGVPEAAAHGGRRADHVGDADPAHAGDGVTGIREMSTILTPPEERHPVLTFVGPYDEKQIAAAIRRELLRDGQVFYIHNRVDSIDRAAARLGELVPEARIAVAHGQMDEHLLEQIMVGFWERSYDVLVSTTIVESGLDIPNANTLIVDRADTFGLSQLHQLRGRVGRGRERGYAYFLYPPEKPLTETAHDRLATDRPAHRAGRGHVRGDEGPGDPRRGQPARRRAVRAHRRASASTCTCGWSARRSASSAATARPSGPRSRSSCRSTPTSRTTTCRASGCGWRPTPDRRRRLRRRHGRGPRRARPTATARRPSRWCTCSRWPGCGRMRRRAGLTDITLQGNHVRFAPVTLPESQEVRLQRLYPRTLLKPAVRTMLVPVPKAVPGGSHGRAAQGARSAQVTRSAPGRCAIRSCSPGARSSSRQCSAASRRQHRTLDYRTLKEGRRRAPHLDEDGGCRAGRRRSC